MESFSVKRYTCLTLFPFPSSRITATIGKVSYEVQRCCDRSKEMFLKNLSDILVRLNHLHGFIVFTVCETNAWFDEQEHHLFLFEKVWIIVGGRRSPHLLQYQLLERSGKDRRLLWGILLVVGLLWLSSLNNTKTLMNYWWCLFTWFLVLLEEYLFILLRRRGTILFPFFG